MVETLWTIRELTAAVEAALAHGYAGPESGRVRSVPDTRTIRYYTTLGLVDRPARMRGRTALYARRHLLQLVAIKRLQVKKRSLAEIQEALAGATDEMLTEISGVSDMVGPSSPSAEGAEAPPEPMGDFWAEEPSAVSNIENIPPATPVADPLTDTNVGSDVLTGARIRGAEGDDLTLLFSSLRTLTPDDLEALREAATPLFETMRSRGLLEPPR